MEKQVFQGTGRRKTSIARVRLISGEGAIQINDRTLEEYFLVDRLRAAALKPLLITDKHRVVSVQSHVNGGGIVSQAGAISHGISRALLKLDPTLRAILKKEGLLTRDSRMKERKKYGQKGARKRFQFSKR